MCIFNAETPLPTVEVSDGTITCVDYPSCSIMYGTDPNNRNLTAVSGQRIPGLLPDETYFYLVTQSIGSQEVEVEGSFMSGVWKFLLYVCCVFVVLCSMKTGLSDFTI